MINLTSATILNKSTEKNDSLKEKIKENEEVEKKLCELTGRNIAAATHKDFYKCSNAQLEAFIMSRKNDAPKYRLPKYRKVGDAIRGERNLLSISFTCKSMPNILEAELQKVEEERDGIGLDNTTNTFSRHAVVVDPTLTHSAKSSFLLDDH